MTNEHNTQPVHGARCIGYSFDTCGAYYRICGFDGSTNSQIANSGKCDNCNRIVQDTELGTVHSESTAAVMAYIEPQKRWVLVQVARPQCLYCGNESVATLPSGNSYCNDCLQIGVNGIL